MGEFSFLNYDKITDTLMYFSKDICLNFCVKLTRKNTNKEVVHFHSEYEYKMNGDKKYSIKRIFFPVFIINDFRDFNNSVMIRPEDITLLQMILTNNVIPWVIGNKRIFSFDNENKLIIKGKQSQVDFPLSDYKYISFAPIVMTYQDMTMKEGIRLTINNKNNYVDIDINKFMEFYYYICNTDMYNAAIGLLNYVKSGPYKQNLIPIGGSNNFNNYDNGYEDWNTIKEEGKKKNFFDSI